MRNIIVLFLGIIILVGVVGIIRRNQPAPLPTAAPQTGTPNMIVEVDLTDSGFMPVAVTVKQGTPVMFVNKSSRQMWVASNPHPTHTDLPGFDELKAGDTYTYVFDKVGTWGYHDHFSPSTQGQVVVTQ
jgi:plastocyanin